MLMPVTETKMKEKKNLRNLSASSTGELCSVSGSVECINQSFSTKRKREFTFDLLAML